MSRVRRKSSGSRNTSSVTAKKQKTIDLGWKNENDDEHIDSGEDEDDYDVDGGDLYDEEGGAWDEGGDGALEIQGGGDWRV